MTPKEITYYCKQNNINPKFVRIFHNAIVVRDPGCNDLSKPRFALAYCFTNNAIIFAEIDNTWEPIVGNKPRKIKINTVKDLKTFLEFVGSLNKDCEKHHCDYNTYYNTYINNNRMKNSISRESTINPNQKIIYDKINKKIIFFESGELGTLSLDETLSDFIDEEDNFTKFADESFEFCEKNKCSLEYYAKEIVYEMLKFKYCLSEYAKIIPQEKMLYTFFDKASKTGFAYYDNNAINVVKITDNGLFCLKMRNKPSSLLKSNEEFEAYIKTNKVSIDKEVKEKIEQHEKQQDLERFANANNEFAGRGPRMA